MIKMMHSNRESAHNVAHDFNFAMYLFILQALAHHEGEVEWFGYAIVSGHHGVKVPGN